MNISSYKIKGLFLLLILLLSVIVTRISYAVPCGPVSSSDANLTVLFDGDGTGFFAGKKHLGLDISLPSGTEVFAVKDGIVRLVSQGSNKNFGNDACIVFIDHEEGQITTYGHLRNGANGMAYGGVRQGDRVLAGQKIGVTADAGQLKYGYAKNLTTGKYEYSGQFSPRLHLAVWQGTYAEMTNPFKDYYNPGTETKEKWVDPQQFFEIHCRAQFQSSTVLKLTDGIVLNPDGPYRVGDALTATFTVKNISTGNITIQRLKLIGKGPGGEFDFWDFTEKNPINLVPNENYSYTGQLLNGFLYNYGDYRFTAVHFWDGVWYSIPINTTVPQPQNPVYATIPDPATLSLITPTKLPPAGVIHPNGTLIKAIDANTVYLIKNGQKCPFPSESIFKAYGYGWHEIILVSATALANYPDGPPVEIPEGSLVKSDTDPAVYIIEGSNKRHIANEQVFIGLGYSWSNIWTVPENILANYTLGYEISSQSQNHPNGSLLVSNGHVFRIENGTKRGFVNAQIFTANGYRWEWVVPASNADLALPDGQIINTLRDGTLVKEMSSPSIHLLDQGKKRHFPTEQVFRDMGYQFANVIDVTSLSIYTNGQDMDLSVPSVATTVTQTLQGNSYQTKTAQSVHYQVTNIQNDIKSFGAYLINGSKQVLAKVKNIGNSTNIDNSELQNIKSVLGLAGVADSSLRMALDNPANTYNGISYNYLDVAKDVVAVAQIVNNVSEEKYLEAMKTLQTWSFDNFVKYGSAAAGMPALGIMYSAVKAGVGLAGWFVNSASENIIKGRYRMYASIMQRDDNDDNAWAATLDACTEAGYISSCSNPNLRDSSGNYLSQDDTDKVIHDLLRLAWDIRLKKTVFDHDKQVFAQKIIDLSSSRGTLARETLETTTLPTEGTFTWEVPDVYNGNYSLRLVAYDVQGNAVYVDSSSFQITSAFAGTVHLPKTGQRSCYDAVGAIISCSGTGQDGEIQSGVLWQNPRYAVINECVTDQLTGLMWSKNGNMAGLKTWQGALDFVASINSGNGLCGYKDWRLPNILEMTSLINYQEKDAYNYLNMQGFSDVVGSYYWTSTTNQYSPDSAWYVHLEDNFAYDYAHKTTNYWFWPVRNGQSDTPDPLYQANIWKTGQEECFNTAGTEIVCMGTGQDGEIKAGVSWPDPRFKDNADGTITDMLTGLMWFKETNCIKAKYPSFDNEGTAGDGFISWSRAFDFVNGINNGTYSNCSADFNDWRIPNVNELASLINFGRTTSIVYPDLYARYWSSTSAWNNWDTAFKDAYQYIWWLRHKTDYGTVLPVRGGFIGNRYDSRLVSNASAVDFAVVQQNKASATKIITLTNMGNSDISINQITLSGSSMSEFSYSSDCATLLAGNTCLINLILTTTSSGQKSATLTISSTHIATPSINVSLVGIGGAKITSAVGIVESDIQTIAVGGTDIVNYKFKLDDGPWSIEYPSTESIHLANLNQGTHTIYVVGKTSLGEWQATASASTASWMTYVPKSSIMGDYNTDYFVDMQDALLGLKILSGTNNYSGRLDLSNADVNGNGKVDMGDILYMLQIVAKIRPVIIKDCIDSDKDGVCDEVENILGMNKNAVDSDHDGLFDREELMVYKTHPTVRDTDGDGINDGPEVRNGCNPKGSGKLSINAPGVCP
jgi:hypothetical protein